MAFTSSPFEGLIATFTESLGLTGFKPVVYDKGGKLELVLSKDYVADLKANDSSQAFYDQVLKPLADSIRQSPVFRGEVAALERDLRSAQNEIKRLECFRTHFELQFALSHGKSIDGLKLRSFP